MKTFLFQGDSITDAGRNRNNDNERGNGYPTLVSAEYLKKFPGEFEFINRAVSGDRVVDVYARIKRDLINLKPDFVSILIGVNDVWHELECFNGVPTAKFEIVYSMIIEEIKDFLPATKIILLEPFVLKGSATLESWGYFHEEVTQRAAAVKRIAEKYRLSFVPLQQKFDEASQDTKMGYWLVDGVHPSAAGHQLIKEALSAEIDKLI